MLAGRPAGRSPFPCVETRHAEGIAPAVAHLVSLGHERIAFLGGRASTSTCGARGGLARGAHNRRAAAGAAGARGRCRGGARARGRAGSAALALLREEPTAIVCSSDALAFEAIAAARSTGLGVPDDLSVVGFDDSALAAFAAPDLTSVRVDYARVRRGGRAGAAGLHRR